jgi:hypothetical protein
VARRACSAKKTDGSACGAPPLHESDLCRMHDPDQAETVAEGRRLGGQNRKRETLLTVVHDFEGLGSIPQIRRLLEIAVMDCLAAERGLNRAKALAYLAQTATKLLDAGEHEERLEALESVLGDRLKKQNGGRR